MTRSGREHVIRRATLAAGLAAGLVTLPPAGAALRPPQAQVQPGQGGPAQGLEFDPNRDVRTGIEVGASIPPFRLRDQSGQWRDFSSVRGPRGAVLLFFRSADW